MILIVITLIHSTIILIILKNNDFHTYHINNITIIKIIHILLHIIIRFIIRILINNISIQNNNNDHNIAIQYYKTNNNNIAIMITITILIKSL